MKRAQAKEVMLSLLGVALIIALVGGAVTFLLPNQPLAGVGDCGTNYVAKDESSPFEYEGETLICKAIVKAGSQTQGEACYGLTEANPSDACYKAVGLGTGSVRVTKIGGSECKDISHVEFYACPRPPTNTPTSTQTSTDTSVAPTSTPTGTEAPTSTPTSTNTGTPETPFKFWTPTPREHTPSPTPTATETQPNATWTPTETGPTPTRTDVTETPTGTVTPRQPKRTPTGTELVRLPNTGEGSPPGDEIGQWLGIGLVIIIIVAAMLRFIWRERNGA